MEFDSDLTCLGGSNKRFISLSGLCILVFPSSPVLFLKRLVEKGLLIVEVEECGGTISVSTRFSGKGLVEAYRSEGSSKVSLKLNEGLDMAVFAPFLRVFVGCYVGAVFC